MGSLLATAFSFESVVDASDIVTAAAAAGTVFLLAAFGVGGGFRMAKKGFSWIMNKI